MGLNLSNRQIAKELDLGTSDVQVMTEQLRQGLTARTPAVILDGEIEIDEVYVTAGHKGNPAAVAKRGDQGDAGAHRRMDPADREQRPCLGTCRTGAQRQERGGTTCRTDHGGPPGQRPASVHLSLHRAR